jgi:hypothetical protein
MGFKKTLLRKYRALAREFGWKDEDFLFVALKFILRKKGRAEAFLQAIETEAYCEGCVSSPWPGICFPIETDGKNDHAYIEACNACKMYEHRPHVLDDYAAAHALAEYLGIQPYNVMAHDDEPGTFFYDMSFEEAIRIEQRFRHLVKCGEVDRLIPPKMRALLDGHRLPDPGAGREAARAAPQEEA